MKNFKKTNNNEKKTFDRIVLKASYSFFEDGAEDLLQIIKPELKDIFADEEGKLYDEINARINLIKWFSLNVPEYGNKDTQFNALTCAYNKINCKFTGYFSIGWNSYIDKETKEKKYTFYYSIESEKVKDIVYNKLLELGWEEEEK